MSAIEIKHAEATMSPATGSSGSDDTPFMPRDLLLYAITVFSLASVVNLAIGAIRAAGYCIEQQKWMST